MLDSLLVHVLLAFAVGGVWVGSASFAARKFSSGIGGLIGGLPAISFVSFLFIGLNQSPDTASQATTAFPLGLAFTFLFLLLYATLADQGFMIAMGTSLLAWFTLSGLETYVHLRNFLFSLGAAATVFAVSIYVFRRTLRLPYVKGAGTEFSILQFIWYVLPGGTVVASAVFFSQILGPTAGGIAAAFPAIFSLTLTFTYRSEGGMNLSRSMTKPLMISAMTVALPYSVLVGWLYPILGLFLGTLAALAAAAPLALLAYFLIHRKRI